MKSDDDQRIAVRAVADGVAAGAFGEWLDATLAALDGGGAMDVPCGSCTACCRAAYFIHVAPDETAALAAIPAALLFPAPGLPDGHRVLGFDRNGHCPMLRPDGCSIYADRPRTCRRYDCRVFAATGIAPEAERAEVGSRAAAWRFTCDDEAERRRFAAVRAAAKFLQSHAGLLPAGYVPANATQLAALAIEVHEVFDQPQDDSASALARALLAAHPR